jgi:hypothetical protein
MKLDARPAVFGGRLSLGWSDRQYSGFRRSGDWILCRSNNRLRS